MSRRMPIALAIATCLSAGPALAVTGPQPGDWALTYRIYVGGLHVLDAAAHVALTESEYRVGVSAETDGFLGRVASWKAEVATTGRLAADGTLRPVAYRAAGEWRDEPRETRLEYAADGTPVVVMAEPPPEEEREPVPPDLIPGTVDPMTAVVAAVQAVAAGRGCVASMPIYDGRQRYDLTFVSKGAEPLAPTEYSVFAGQAEACGFEFKPLAGRWKEQDRRRGRDEEDRRRGRRDGRDVTVWVAPAAPGAPPVPVRAESSSPLGTVVIHLAAIDRVAAPPRDQAAEANAR